MSGGHFNYNQWRIRDIEEQIDELTYGEWLLYTTGGLYLA